MPRHARKLSFNGIYHVIIRGINRQIIFEDSDDYRKFIYLLRAQQLKTPFSIFSYCLMDNHVHLLLREEETPISDIIKSVLIRFVYWYNAKYERIGHLFADRFKSECVEEETYFLSAARYIHNNPVKAGIVTHPADYLWSSALAYWGAKDDLVDTEMISGLCSDFKFFQLGPNADECMDVGKIKQPHLTDETAFEIIKKLTSCNGPSDFQHLPKETRNRYLIRLHQTGISIRQLNRLTGIPKTTIEYQIRHNKSWD